ncbi:gluconate 2-dehydrogenase subunit 3 family protein [Neorhizobium galegae]|uniref:gluconate 2-dehydrogenase subunit 3 family protein n=1 Tax=Neorhizobium galegae TaxID=399 RepID=UPI0021064F7A|nr:gluconate 2-dehydrogenase subunit 3 family protein [Neorhizobium galegae]MCQ1768492.1 gluconate 2-dehydrogenase subunit 3 family protein [Neorhizobium galegae]MCQ1847464.1 gluconate 2-dehydrogenase subunit 3 family protein [Neorhizobium galegae]
MTEQSDSLVKRRGFLLGTAAIGALAVAAAIKIGKPFEAVAASDILRQAAPELHSYQPSFFTEDEFRTLSAMVDRFIPAGDEGPGALETNVPIFLDLQVGGDYGHEIYLEGPFVKDPSPLMGYQLPYLPSDIYRKGLAIFSAEAKKIYGKDFADLTDAQKDEFLTACEKGKIDFAAHGEEYLTSSGFFGHVLGDTKNGYLADPMYGGNKGMGAWAMIGYPGARASFREWVKQHNVPYPLGPVSVMGERA